MEANTKEIQPKLFDWTSHPNIEGWFWMWDQACNFLQSKPRIYRVYCDEEIGWIATTLIERYVFKILLDDSLAFHFYGPLPLPPEEVLTDYPPWDKEYSSARILKGTKVRCKINYDDEDSVEATYLGRTPDYTDFVKLDDGTIIEAKSVDLI